MRLLLLIGLALLSVFPAWSRQRALLVGVGEYPAETGWNAISSRNDLTLLEKAAPAFSFDRLSDADATHDGIIGAFDKFTAETGPGDTVWVHFSCHGQQMLAVDNDESDLLDEALIPFDAPMYRSSAYTGNHHLTDNELDTLITRLRQYAGSSGLLVVTIDACFSDSMDKGTKRDSSVIYRGGADIFGCETVSADSLQRILSRRMALDKGDVSILPDGADVVFLSACKSYQRNREVSIQGTGYGSLSFALADAFRVSGFADLTAWLDRVYVRMGEIAYTQTPQVRSTIGYAYKPSAIVFDEGVSSGLVRSASDGGFWFYVIACVILVVVVVLWITRIRK